MQTLNTITAALAVLLALAALIGWLRVRILSGRLKAVQRRNDGLLQLCENYRSEWVRLLQRMEMK